MTVQSANDSRPLLRSSINPPLLRGEVTPAPCSNIRDLHAAQDLGVADAFDVRLAPCCAAIHEVSDEWRRLARSAVLISLPPKGPLS